MCQHHGCVNPADWSAILRHRTGRHIVHDLCHSHRRDYGILQVIGSPVPATTRIGRPQ